MPPSFVHTFAILKRKQFYDQSGAYPMPIPLLDSPDRDVLRDQFEAWMAGAVARAGGHRQLHENPHESRSRKADAWENGWEVINQQLESGRVSMNRLKPFQERVIEEKAELDEKLKKLDTFLRTESYSMLPSAEQVRLNRLYVIMEAYSVILGGRIAAFTE